MPSSGNPRGRRLDPEEGRRRRMERSRREASDAYYDRRSESGHYGEYRHSSRASDIYDRRASASRSNRYEADMEDIPRSSRRMASRDMQHSAPSRSQQQSRTPSHAPSKQGSGILDSAASVIGASGLPNSVVIPVIAFVLLAAIGIFATSFNSDPAYDAIFEIPGEPLVAQAEAAESEDATSEEGEVLAEGAAQQEQRAEIDISSLPSSTEVVAFSATGANAPSISDEALSPISAAYEQLTEGGIDAGFVFVSLESGNGITSNADQKVYGASTIKGPMIAYICEELIDGGEISTDTNCKTMTESFKSNGKSSVGNLIEQTITQSANGTYGGLYTTYGDDDYSAWLESIDVDPGIYERSDWYAWYTARDAAKMWRELYSYFQSDSETASWLQGLMQSTNVSFIRDATETLRTQLEEQEWRMPTVQGGAAKLIRTTADSVTGYRSANAILDSVTVTNKAGWCVGDSSDVDYDSTSDNAIVTIDGHDYLLCIMTGAPYNERNASNVTNLAAQLIATYDSLV